MSISLSNYKDRDRILIVENGRLNNNLPFTRSSTATYLNGANTIVTASNDIPRYEYSAAGAYLGLLIEESRTNLAKWSSDYTNAVWTKASGTTVTANAVVAPDGTTTAAQIDVPSSNAGVYQSISFTVTAGVKYALSVWLRAASSTTIQIGTNGLGHAANNVGVNLSITSTWTKYTFILTAGGNDTGLYICIAATGWNGAGAAITSARTVFAWGAQLETGATVSSYIPTTTASVTRSADVAQATLSTIGISTTAGTFVIEHDVASGKPLIYSGSNTVLDSSGGTKVAIAYDGSGWVKSVNGAATTTGAALTFSTTLDVAKSSTTSANGHIKRLVWYNTKRAAAELQALST